MTGLIKLICLLIFLLGSLGDSVSTYICAKRFGIQGEKNPIVRGLMDVLGVLPAIILKFILLGVLGVALYTKPYAWVNLIIGVAYMYATIHNFQELKKSQ